MLKILKRFLLKRQKIFILILLGLIIRLVLALISGFKIDMDTWFAWASRLNQIPLNQFYSTEVWTNYTPGYLYILKVLGFLKGLFLISNSSFYLILKLPTILAEVILGILVYLEIKTKYSQNLAHFFTGFILFNPGFIFDSSIWGQVDGILTLFLYLTIRNLIGQKIFTSGFLAGMALLIKPQTIFILPILGFFFLKQKSIKSILKFSLSFFGIILFLSLPFFKESTILNLTQLIFNMTKDYPYSSLFAFNFWGIFGFWIKDTQQILGISLNLWGYILSVVYLMIIYSFYFQKKISIYLLTALTLLIFYFLPTRIHERYLYPGLFFLILSLAEYKNKILTLLVYTLNIIFFLNLYYVYIYYNYFYYHLDSLIYLTWLYKMVEVNVSKLSLLSTLIFISITSIILKQKHVKTF